MDIPMIQLKGGASIPVLGLGTWQLKGRRATEAVRMALDMGYTHIDTASVYGNHMDIGEAISGYDRSRIWITSKVWRDSLGHDDIIREAEKALEELGTDYLDLYLIHWPNPDFPMAPALQALQNLKEEGKVRAIGVSNFTIKHMEEALETGIEIATNQVEFHAHLYQKDLLDLCMSNGVYITAYSPIARGAVLKDPVIEEISLRLGRTPAQVALRWLLQKRIIVIPKSGSKYHIKENMGLFGWELSESDMDAIDRINQWKREVDAFGTFDD